MLSLKTGVNPKGVQPELLLAIITAERIYDRKGYAMVITSLFDGKHGEHTLHQRDGICRAVDLRTRDVSPAHIPAIVQDLKDALGENYDVIMESDHVHLEYDPKVKV